MTAATLFEHIEFQGMQFPIENGVSNPVIPPPMGAGDGQASSIQVYGPNWITFWEAINFGDGDDQLWIAPPPAGKMWVLKNLHTFFRPHGNNHWGDRIRGVSFSGAPTGDNDNRTIIHPDGHVTNGNQSFTFAQLKERGMELDIVPAANDEMGESYSTLISEAATQAKGVLTETLAATRDVGKTESGIVFFPDGINLIDLSVTAGPAVKVEIKIAGKGAS